MDPASLAVGFVALLVPVLRRWGGEAASSAAQSAGDALGEDAARRVLSLWERLRPGVNVRRAAREAAATVESGADGELARARLAGEIARLLTADRSLRQEAAAILREVRIDVTGDGNVVQVGDTNTSISNARDVHIGDWTER
jgi:hypothetical protein